MIRFYFLVVATVCIVLNLLSFRGCLCEGFSLLRILRLDCYCISCCEILIGTLNRCCLSRKGLLEGLSWSLLGLEGSTLLLYGVFVVVWTDV
mgnify:CR=1 FL=1